MDKNFLKRITVTFILLGVTLSILGLLTERVSAQTELVEIREYTVLAPLPGTTIGGGRTATLASYIPGLFRLVLGLASVIAVSYIIFGGFLYISTDAIQGKQDGKKHITNAIYGLIMIGVSWLILYTINPNLLAFNLNIGALPAPTRLVGGGLAPSSQCTDCVRVTGIRLVNTGTSVSQTIINRVQGLNTTLTTQNLNWWISEANPPTGVHADPCHNNGTCIDAKIDNMSSVNTAEARNINTFLSSARSSGFSVVQFEVRTQQERAAWAAQGVTATVNSSATGPHFHIER